MCLHFLRAYLLFGCAVFAQPGKISLVAGGVPLGEGRPGTEAHFYWINAVIPDNKGGVLIADRGRIIQIDSDGIMRTIAGSLTLGFSGDGAPALGAKFSLGSWPGWGGIALDDEGGIYVADTANNRIRRIDKEGIVRTVAGNGLGGFGGDGGPAAQAQIRWPGGIARATDGTLYITSLIDHRIRKIDPKGTITTFAGDGVPPTIDGSGGELDRRRLNASGFVALDGNNNLYVSDAGANVVRRISPDGTISLVAGTGKAGFSGDSGPAIDAQLRHPGP